MMHRPPHKAARRLYKGTPTLRWCILAACLGLLPTSPAFTQPIDTWSEMGRLPIRYIDPSEYGASKENWDIEQDGHGLVYVGNSSGLLIHDGVTWELLPPVQNSMVREMARTEEDVIFYGGFNDFGYVETDAQGRHRLVSLVDHVPEPDRAFDDIWKIVTRDDAVFFQAPRHLFRWQNDTLTVWHPDGRLSDINIIGDRLIIPEEDHFSWLTDADTLQAIPLEFGRPDRTGAFISDGPDHVLMLRINGLLRCGIALDARNGCVDWAPELNATLKQYRPFGIARLPDSTIAVGFDGQGLALLSPEGNLKRLIGESDGLENLEVMTLHATDQGVLWMALYDGIARMEPDGYLSSFTKAEGLPSEVNTLARWNGTIWASTMLGLYQLIPGGRGTPARFERVPRSETYINCNDMVVVGGQLLVDCGLGIQRFVVDAEGDGRVVDAFDEKVFNLVVDPTTPDWLYAGSKERLLVLHVNGTEVEVIHSLPVEGDVNTVALRPHRHAEESTEIWAHASSGTFHRFVKTPRDTAWVHTRYPPVEAVRDIFKIFWVHGSLGAITNEGIYTISPAEDGSLTAAPYPHIPKSESFNSYLGSDSDGTVWLYAGHRFWRVLPPADGEVAVDSIAPHPLLNTLIEPNAMLVDADRSLWFAHGRGTLHLQYEALTRDTPRLHLRIAKVQSLVSDHTLYPAERTSQQAVVFPYTSASLRFDFAAQVHDFPEHVAYRVWLEGFDATWQPWSSATGKEFTNLHEGAYTLHVKARDAYGEESEAVSFAFRVSPPWYRTPWAYALWALAALLLISGVTIAYEQARHRWLKARNLVLERTVAERTREIQQQKEAVERANDELLQANHNLSERTNQLREALEVNKEILGVTAHDLKNPLGGVIGLSELVIMNAEENPNTTVRSVADILSMIRDAADRMLKIVQELLDKHRQGNTNFLTIEPASLSAIVTRALLWNNRQAEQKNIRIHFTDDAPSDVACDVVAIQRAVDNYLSNAVKYSPPGSDVWVSLTPDENKESSMVCLTVRDEGPGLTEEDMTRVFGKMKRLSAKPTAGEHSTGLGLYIVKHLVEAHGGAVGVESTPGEGATFWLSLPLLTTPETIRNSPPSFSDP